MALCSWSQYTSSCQWTPGNWGWWSAEWSVNRWGGGSVAPVGLDNILACLTNTCIQYSPRYVILAVLLFVLYVLLLYFPIVVYVFAHVLYEPCPIHACP